MRTRIFTLLAILIAAATVPVTLVVFTMIARSSLATSFGAVVALSIALPPLLNPVARRRELLLLVAVSVLLIALLLLVAPMSVPQWFGVVAIIGSTALFIVGAGSIFRFPAIVVVVMLLWLSWPIWLSERLAGHDAVVNALSTIHPLLAINGQLLDQAIWTERPLMYKWTGLNQDVPFAMPTTIFWCVLVHGGIGLALLLISSGRKRWMERST